MKSPELLFLQAEQSQLSAFPHSRGVPFPPVVILEASAGLFLQVHGSFVLGECRAGHSTQMQPQQHWAEQKDYLSSSAVLCLEQLRIPLAFLAARARRCSMLNSVSTRTAFQMGVPCMSWCLGLFPPAAGLAPLAELQEVLISPALSPSTPPNPVLSYCWWMNYENLSGTSCCYHCSQQPDDKGWILHTIMYDSITEHIMHLGISVWLFVLINKPGANEFIS